MALNQFTSPEGDLDNYLVTEYWLIDQWVGDTLWTWGNNSYGHLGINVSVGAASRSTPLTTFAGGTNWKQVSCAGNNTAAIKTDGTLWTWGYNLFGQVGNNVAFGPDVITPVTTFAGGTNWKQVSCGNFSIGPSDNTTAAIKTDGTLWVWGSGSNGQVGNNTSTFGVNTPVTTFAGGTNWKQVSCGSHTAAIKTDGTLWVWGRNTNGQLGDNTTVNRSTPVTTFAGGTNWKQVSGGSFHTAALRNTGQIMIWGRNTNGQLGDNTTTDRSTPVTTFAGGTNWKQVSCGREHTTAIKTDGTLWTWGRNSAAQLGDNTTTNRLTPVTTFAGGTNWKQVAGGDFHTAAITSGTDPTYFIS